MRRSLMAFPLLILLSCVLPAPRAYAQVASGDKVSAEETESDLMTWKLINTGIFIVALGWGVLKFAPKFFQARSFDIQRAIKEATGLKIDADFRYSEIDKKMAELPDEVNRLKAEGAAEMDREHKRLMRETASEIEHLLHNADYEIESLRAEGARQVKRHTTQLAFALAERRLQTYFSHNEEQNNVGEFVGLVTSDAKSGGDR